jgi:hypothetical protein
VAVNRQLTVGQLFIIKHIATSATFATTDLTQCFLILSLVTSMRIADRPMTYLTSLVTGSTFNDPAVFACCQAFVTTADQIALFALLAAIRTNNVSGITDDWRTVSPKRSTTVCTLTFLKFVSGRCVWDGCFANPVVVADLYREFSDVVGYDGRTDVCDVGFNCVSRRRVGNLLPLFLPKFFFAGVDIFSCVFQLVTNFLLSLNILLPRFVVTCIFSFSTQLADLLFLVLDLFIQLLAALFVQIANFVLTFRSCLRSFCM